MLTIIIISWCGPCKKLTPKLKVLAKKDQGQWVLAKCNIDEYSELAGAFEVFKFIESI